MNRLLIGGRVSRKGVLSYSSNGIAFLDLIIATPRRENLKMTEYLPILLKGDAAESAQDVEVGHEVEVEGYIQIETSLDKDAKPFEKIKLLGEKIREIPTIAGMTYERR